MKMRCVKSSYKNFEAGKVYELEEQGTSGRFRVFRYTDEKGHYCTFGLDDNGENNCECNFMKFEPAE